jgi:hypothetical protein
VPRHPLSPYWDRAPRDLVAALDRERWTPERPAPELDGYMWCWDLLRDGKAVSTLDLASYACWGSTRARRVLRRARRDFLTWQESAPENNHLRDRATRRQHVSNTASTRRQHVTNTAEPNNGDNLRPYATRDQHGVDTLTTRVQHGVNTTARARDQKLDNTGQHTRTPPGEGGQDKRFALLWDTLCAAAQLAGPAPPLRPARCAALEAAVAVVVGDGRDPGELEAAARWMARHPDSTDAQHARRNGVLSELLRDPLRWCQLAESVPMPYQQQPTFSTGSNGGAVASSPGSRPPEEPVISTAGGEQGVKDPSGLPEIVSDPLPE